MNENLTGRIFKVNSKQQFENITLEVFRHQALSCKPYRAFIENLNIDPLAVTRIENIPFLPIEFFKTSEIISGNRPAEIVFTSSGTTGMATSRHLVTDAGIYRESYRRSFSCFYGDVKNYCILALLPSYLEREGSSLIYMVEDLIKQSNHPGSGFFLFNHDDLFKTLNRLKQQNTPTILIGVTYALLDFIENYPISFPGLTVMETGGMKGKRREMIREELHEILCKGFRVETIHSEYGMTELLSQAYSKGKGIFNSPAWMQILIRDTNDPFTLLEENQTGGINIIDLANINSCSFIATQDLGKRKSDGSFEILGRFDNSDIRGCNLLVQ